MASWNAKIKFKAHVTPILYRKFIKMAKNEEFYII